MPWCSPQAQMSRFYAVLPRWLTRSSRHERASPRGRFRNCVAASAERLQPLSRVTWTGSTHRTCTTCGRRSYRRRAWGTPGCSPSPVDYARYGIIRSACGAHRKPAAIHRYVPPGCIRNGVTRSLIGMSGYRGRADQPALCPGDHVSRPSRVSARSADLGVNGIRILDLALISMATGPLRREQDSLAEQQEAVAAVHLAFDHLKSRLTLPSATPEFQDKVRPFSTAP
jgi:hypothetical protein